MIQRPYIGLYVTAVIGLVDQITKWFVLDGMGDVHKTVPVTSFLNIVLVWNKGITFGFLSQSSQEIIPYILVAVAVVILGLLGRWLIRTTSAAVAIALGGIMGGAIGNVVDRIRYGAVVDFLDFHFAGHHWYAFNVADAAIVTGVALLLIDGMVRGK